MSRIYRLLEQVEGPLFLHVNIRWNRMVLNRLFAILTFIGGAIFSLGFSLAMGLLLPGEWSAAGWQALAAIALSHLPVAIAKRSAPRKRPHQVFPQANIGRRPLQDPSFPSGHTTAAFAMLTPWMMASPALIPALLPIAIGVALSRVYFGLHFPSDTIVGALIGSATALFVSLWI
ncbi:phosphatase PAP2 family protein [Cohnella lubricantis]|uniref:Phosphatase PAP2 family protein n=1 Tax=Cohnella lubricantis TaxID=2163172 RepID=A0A841TFR1_9BACL|nr:phosphatase PAP2 family protein [Cohnella lubricantis]MBB6677787.1 phosphatase PAP2 family protein [Cohnella lubricantis]MBP2119003.1 undecaprenyl-diphosphatase [Cohnella lubricantis]